MDWIQLSVYCAQEGLEQVSAALGEQGALEQEIVEDVEGAKAHLQQTRGQWDYIDEASLLAARAGGSCVRVYVSDDPDGRQKRQDIHSALANLAEMGSVALGFDPATLRIEEKTVREQDWSETWRQFYHSMEIGERLIVVPEWEEGENPPGRVVLRMEPGLVFGTGEHQTTQLCLAMVEAHLKPGMRILDIGCGSGILSVAALLLGADTALALDVDPNARGVAYENAARNGVDHRRYDVQIGDILQSTALQEMVREEGPYDMVLSNIVADVIIALGVQVSDCLKPGGLWVASGIITDRLAEVSAAMEEHGFAIMARRQQDDWWALLGAKGREDSI